MKGVEEMQKIIAVILTLTLLVLSLPLAAFAQDDDNDIVWDDDSQYEDGSLFDYEILDDGTISLTKYNGENTQLFLPSSIDGYTVTGLSSRIFASNFKYTKIVLPNTIQTISSNAFDCCYYLEYVNIPSSVWSIGKEVFRFTRNLKAIDFDNDNMFYKYIDGVIYNSNFSQVVGCVGGIEEVTLPSSVTKINYGAFEGCQYLKTVNGGKNVKEIEAWGMASCYSLESIENFTNLQIIRQYAFSNARSLTKVVIPSSVTTFERDAFSGSTGIKELYFYANVDAIPIYAFESCHYLNNVFIGEGVKTIDDGAFRYCSRLQSVHLPESLTSIGSESFNGPLKAVYVPASVKRIGNKNFGDNRSQSTWKETHNSNFLMFGHSGTSAQTYAQKNNIKFIDVDNDLIALGGSLRVSEPNGLRLGFSFKGLDLSADEASAVEAGFVYSYSSTSDNLIKENIGENGVKGIVVNNYTVENQTTTANLVFTNIPKASIETDVTAKAYITVSGYTFYSTALTRNAFYVAQRAVNDESLSQTIKERIRSIYGL